MTQSSSSQSQPKSASQLSKRIKLAEEMSPEEQAKNDEIDARCLAICVGMLRHINGVCPSLQSSHLLKFDHPGCRLLTRTPHLKGFSRISFCLPSRDQRWCCEKGVYLR